MNHDISQILDDWKYDPDSNVRRIRGDDGVAKIQVRVDQGAFQGILQLNLDGRPDGKRPHDRDFALDHYRDTLVEIRGVGVVAYWSRQFEPYLRAAAQQFSPGRRSLTERLLDRRNSPPSAR